MIWNEILLLFILLALVLVASMNMEWGVFLPSLCRIFTTSKEVVLTFDDGPHPVYTPELLDFLKERGLTATFFLIGENAEKNPEIVKRIVMEGHRIGIHSYYHKPAFTYSSKKKVIDELVRTKAILEKITGREVILFRPPFGVTNPNIAAAVRSLNLKAVGWSLRTLDTIGKPEGWVLARVDKSLSEGDIILMHDRMSGCLSLVKRVLDLLDKRGYKVVGL